MNSLFYARLLVVASFLGAMGVVIGAFGAHFLKSRLEAADLDIIRTGVLYLFIHVGVIFIVALLARNNAAARLLKSAGLLYILGIILFSGSLFFLATQSLTGLNISYVGMLTPMGGMCFISGWIMLTIYSFSLKS